MAVGNGNDGEVKNITETERPREMSNSKTV